MDHALTGRCTAARTTFFSAAARFNHDDATLLIVNQPRAIILLRRLKHFHQQGNKSDEASAILF
jgi:hypothetical protein